MSYCMGSFASTMLLGHWPMMLIFAFLSRLTFLVYRTVVTNGNSSHKQLEVVGIQYFCPLIILLLYNYMLIRYSFTLFWQFVYVFVQFALPHIMGWDQALTSHPQSPSSAPASRPRVDRPNPDSEWDRWSFFLGPDRRRVSNTTASRHWIVWKCGTFELCFLRIQLSEMFVSDFMILKRLKLGRSTIKPYVCSVHGSILNDLCVVSCACRLQWCKPDAYVI
jgi:hypothetical protein